MSIFTALPFVGKILGGAAEKFIDRLGEKDRREFEALLTDIEYGHQAQLAQIEVNKAEAQHSSIFVAGWRPFIGWTCGLVFVASGIVAIWGAIFGVTPDQVEALGLLREMMMPILLGLLGLGGMRTAEKFRGVARRKIK